MYKTVFGDLRLDAVAVYRVSTQAHVYTLAIHEARGRRFIVVRGQVGTDREHVVVRDSDPRIGDQSLFDLPIEQWPGKVLEVATMTTSAITAVERENDPDAIAAVAGDRNLWSRPQPEPAAVVPPGGSGHYPPPPAGMSRSPAIALGMPKGTSPFEQAQNLPPMPAMASNLAKQVVVGQPSAPTETPEPELPYPKRHVRYAENVAALLRSIARRDRIFDDVSGDRELRERLRRALDDSATLLETIRRRDRT